jgi:hypothetical protein
MLYAPNWAPRSRNSVPRSGTARGCPPGFARRRSWSWPIAGTAPSSCWDSAFERYAHEAVGRTAGLTDEELAALRTGMSPGFSDTAEQTAYAVAQALTMRQGLSDTEYARAHEILGKAAIVELSTLIGYYAPLALQLRTFRVGVSPNLDS